MNNVHCAVHGVYCVFTGVRYDLKRDYIKQGVLKKVWIIAKIQKKASNSLKIPATLLNVHYLYKMCANKNKYVIILSTICITLAKR